MHNISKYTLNHHKWQESLRIAVESGIWWSDEWWLDEKYLESTETVSVDEEFSDDRESVRVLYNLPVVGDEEVMVCVDYDRKNRFLQDVTIESSSTNIGRHRDNVIRKMKSFCIDEE